MFPGLREAHSRVVPTVQSEYEPARLPERRRFSGLGDVRRPPPAGTGSTRAPARGKLPRILGVQLQESELQKKQVRHQPPPGPSPEWRGADCLFLALPGLRVLDETGLALKCA
ncbi:hypothetical protein GCM10010402_37690 [Actinomadura luteofluorescens]